MSALTHANIPSSINTYERLAAWVIQCLQNTGNGQEVNVQRDSQAQPVAQASLVVTADGVYRYMLTAYLPCDQNLLNDPSQKTWMATKEISTAAPHLNFLAN
jgi:hypothetical protein